MARDRVSDEKLEAAVRLLTTLVRQVNAAADTHAPVSPSAAERRMFPRKEAAHYLGISLRALDQLGSDGDMPKVVIAGRTLYDRADLDEYVERVKHRM
jgi:hypothetical protein